MGKLIKGNHASLFMWAFIATLLSQNLVILSTANFQDQKNFFHFPPNPYSEHIPPVSSTPTIGTSPPTGSTASPGQGSGGGSQGSTPPATNCPNAPCGGHQSPTTPISTPSTPSTPTTPGSIPSPPSTPSTPTTPGSIPSPPSTPSTPTTPSSIPSPPSTPSTPTTPSSLPSPPFVPKTPFTGTCNFWKNHPQYIAAILGMSGTLGKAFGLTSLAGFGPHTSILDLLSNNHKDGFGSLYREGTASLLNSMVNINFPYSTKQVRDNFLGSLSSEKAAAQQANLFKLANEG